MGKATRQSRDSLSAAISRLRLNINVGGAARDANERHSGAYRGVTTVETIYFVRPTPVSCPRVALQVAETTAFGRGGDNENAKQVRENDSTRPRDDTISNQNQQYKSFTA